MDAIKVCATKIVPKIIGAHFKYAECVRHHHITLGSKS